MIERCQERNKETGQCELRADHSGKHLAGYLLWPSAPAEPQGDAPRPSKLDALNRAFTCAYIECPGYVIDDLRQRFNEYLGELLAHREAAEQRATKTALEAAARLLKPFYPVGPNTQYDDINSAIDFIMRETISVPAETTLIVHLCHDDRCITRGHHPCHLEECSERLDSSHGPIIASPVNLMRERILAEQNQIERQREHDELSAPQPDRLAAHNFTEWWNSYKNSVEYHDEHYADHESIAEAAWVAAFHSMDPLPPLPIAALRALAEKWRKIGMAAGKMDEDILPLTKATGETLLVSATQRVEQSTPNIFIEHQAWCIGERPNVFCTENEPFDGWFVTVDSSSEKVEITITRGKANNPNSIVYTQLTEYSGLKPTPDFGASKIIWTTR